MEKSYGKELVLDMHNCDSSKFTREVITDFYKDICDKLEMERCDLHFWDDVDTPEEEKQTEPHLTGTSAIQFIMTSNITIHTLDLLDKVFINIFTCGHLDVDISKECALAHFGGEIVQSTELVRK